MYEDISFHFDFAPQFLWICCDGIPKLPLPGRMRPDRRPSRGDFECIVVPEAERICSCMTIGTGGEPITAGFEDGVDLVMGGGKPLRLPG